MTILSFFKKPLGISILVGAGALALGVSLDDLMK